MSRVVAVIMALALLLIAPAGAAHSRGTSYSFWNIGADKAEARARVSQLELTRLRLDPSYTPDYLRRVGEVLAERLQLRGGSEGAHICQPGPVTARTSADGWVHASWGLVCPAWNELSVRSDLLLEVAPSHLHFVRVELPGGEIRQQTLTAAAPVLELPSSDATKVSASLGRYVALGVEHILSGWDHLAFVLALLLLARTLKEVAIIATGFTLAHSLTLAAAVLGLVHARVERVEAVIGFSIALCAVENLWRRSERDRWAPAALILGLLGLALTFTSRLPPALLLGLALFTGCYFASMRQSQRPERLRVAIAFVFGLVHGFGFAGALTELRLPAEQLAIALLGFNAGVELGQLLVIALVWPALSWLSRFPASKAWFNDAGAAAICAIGTYWFLVRSLG